MPALKESAEKFLPIFLTLFLIGNVIAESAYNFTLKSNIIMDTNDSEEKIVTFISTTRRIR